MQFCFASQTAGNAFRSDYFSSLILPAGQLTPEFPQFGLTTPKGNTMPLNDDIDKSAEWLSECNSSIDGAAIGDSTRNRVAAALLHLSLEHHGAIQLLVSSQLPHYGSAFALLRPQFEGYVRGVWFHRCACDQELDEFTKGGEPPRIDKLIQAIETVPGYEKGLLKATKQEVWRIMCGYTHGGSVQVASRNSYTEITSSYTDEQVHELISLACSITLLVSVAFAQLLGDNAMANRLLSTYLKLFLSQSTT